MRGCQRRAVAAVVVVLAGASGAAAQPASGASPVAALGAPWADSAAPLPATALPLADTERRAALDCLAAAVSYEAGNESLSGQQAVAQVVLNRLRHPAFPKTLCGVVYQGSARRTGCQFTFTCDGSLMRPRSPRGWAAAQAVAAQAIDGRLPPTVGTATHYHANYVMPRWAPALVRVGAIGAHIFYRFPGPAGSVAAFAARGDRLTSRRGSAARPATPTAAFRPWGLAVATGDDPGS